MFEYAYLARKTAVHLYLSAFFKTNHLLSTTVKIKYSTLY